MSSGVIFGRKFNPLMKFRFRVLIPDFEEMGFTAVRNLRSEVPVLEIEEGGNQIPYKFPDRKINFGNILLSKGLGRTHDLRIWFEENMKWKRGMISPIFRPVLITLLDERMRAAAAWELFDAWPTIVEIDDLDAASDEVIIQRVELANSGIVLRSVSEGAMFSGTSEAWWDDVGL